MNNDLEMFEVREKWESQNKINHYEGTRGVDNLQKLLAAIGYKEGNYLGYNNEIINFLSDNSGAIEALLQFIDDSRGNEWKENLSEGLEDEEND